MRFRRFKNIFDSCLIRNFTFKGTDVLLVSSSAHYGQIVKVGDQYFPTVYTHIYPDLELLKEIYELTEPLSLREIRKLRHHLTSRIWMCDGVFECINWQMLNKEPQPKKCKLLPPYICYACMLEGNKYIPKQIKIHGRGLCRCCGKEKVVLHDIRRGWPIDLRHKGFGFTVIGSGRNYTMNIEYYHNNFDMSIYTDYVG